MTYLMSPRPRNFKSGNVQGVVGKWGVDESGDEYNDIGWNRGNSNPPPFATLS
jgi:hypothetical protein